MNVALVRKTRIGVERENAKQPAPANTQAILA